MCSFRCPVGTREEGRAHMQNHLFLGIVIDTLLGELSLPQEKLDRLLAAVKQWESKKYCTRRELESLHYSMLAR